MNNLQTKLFNNNAIAKTPLMLKKAASVTQLKLVSRVDSTRAVKSLDGKQSF
jgi:hypothetical protein